MGSCHIVEVWGGGGSAVQSHNMGGLMARAEGHTHTHTQEHTHTHRGTYTRMLHLPFSDLPLKKCPSIACILSPSTQKTNNGEGDSHRKPADF